MLVLQTLIGKPSELWTFTLNYKKKKQNSKCKLENTAYKYMPIPWYLSRNMLKVWASPPNLQIQIIFQLQRILSSVMKSESMKQITDFSPLEYLQKKNIQQMTKYRVRAAASGCKCKSGVSLERCTTCWNCKFHPELSSLVIEQVSPRWSKVQSHCIIKKAA